MPLHGDGERRRIAHAECFDDAVRGTCLDIEASAPDGVVEAFRVRNAPSFAVAVQWHPEWQFSENPFSLALFAAFGAAARERAQKDHMQNRMGHP